MNLNAWLTLLGVVLSPILAVIITLWVEGRRRDHDGKMLVIRALLATRHLPGDANYNTAINLIPAEFHRCPPVMAAFKDYQRQVRQVRPPTAEAAAVADREVATAQTKLISAALRAVGMKVSEADLAIEAYASEGFLFRDRLYLASLDAQVRTAAALERSIDAEVQEKSG